MYKQLKSKGKELWSEQMARLHDLYSPLSILKDNVDDDGVANE